MFPGSGLGGGLFEIIPVLVVIVFVVSIGSMIVRGGVSLNEWQNNNEQPVLRRKVKVIGKRDKVTVRIVVVFTTSMGA